MRSYTEQPNTIVYSQDALDKALDLCRGHYQRGLLLGHHALSGADLGGMARQYSGRYADSRSNLLNRLSKAGVPWCERTGHHNKRILVIGAES